MNTIPANVRAFVPHIIAIFISVIFLSSLPYKFTLAPETQVIFGRLNDWVVSLGLPGLFAPSGLLSSYVIGSVEAVASVFLLLGITRTFRHFQAYGAVLALGVMSGAVFFHLFTPLGIDPNNDGGGLFMMAVLSLLGSAYLVFRYRKTLHV